MTKYRLTVPREAKNGKTYWDPVGVMFKRDNGGYSIVLHMFPGLKVMAFPDDKKDTRPVEERHAETIRMADDDIPF